MERCLGGRVAALVPAGAGAAQPPLNEVPLIKRTASRIRSSRLTPLPQPPALRSVRAQAGAVSPAAAGWWTKEVPANMKHVSSVQELVDELAEGAKADQLVVVDFFAPWCGACRTLFPKLRQICDSNPDVRFLAVNFEADKALARGLGVKVLPFFHFYRGAEGRVAAFAASVSKVAKLREAIEDHKSARCFLEETPAVLLPEFPTVAAGGAAQPQLVA